MINLNLYFTPYPLGTVKRRALLFFCFEEPQSKPDGIWSFNSRTSKYLRSLWLRKFWTGGAREILLVSCKDLGSAEWILLVGLGKRSFFSTDIFEDRLIEAGKTLGRLRINDFGFCISVIDKFEEGYISHFENSLISIIKAFQLEYKNRFSNNIYITASLEDEIMKIMKSRTISLEGRLEEIVSECNIEFQGDEVFFTSARM